MKTTIISFLRLIALAGITIITPARATINMDYVSVGNPGNAADTADGDNNTAGVQRYGSVGYVYQIAKNETTISQYAEFLNAVAKTDTYGLYSTNMTVSYINGISRSGVSGAYSYTAATGSGNKPITFVNWYNAARFCNWVQNGQLTGAQNASTTETGAYTLNGVTSGVIVNRNVGATVWIPSEDEWYKAAYYDPNKGGPGVGGYWSQATQSNTVAGNTAGVASSANYFDGDYVGSGNASFPTSIGLTDVGAYGMNSDSAYGTNDQSGNVWEWNDAVIDEWGGVVIPPARATRGGSWDFTADGLASSFRSGKAPSDSFGYLGFRVASVPEPTSVVLTIFASGLMLIRRKR